MSEKTEPPTPKKLREAREKGQVAKSRDLAQAFLFAVIAAILIGTAASYSAILQRFMVLPGAFYTSAFAVAVREMGQAALDVAMSLLVPLMAAVALTGIIGNVIQTGFMFSPKSMAPELSKISPATQLKQMFSVKNLIEFIKSIVKIVVLVLLLYGVIKGGLRDLLLSGSCGLDCVIRVTAEMTKQVVYTSMIVFFIIAGADFFLQYQQHMKQLRMSKDEVKREYKEMEGDPLIKSKRHQFHQELMAENSTQRARTASVLVTNPTEFAVAIFYRAEETPLPLVVAKGQGFMAKRMVTAAREEGVPIMQNIPLARGLYAEAEIDQYIPSSMIEPVAEVLRWVQENR
jgi:type III secretion protein U